MSRFSGQDLIIGHESELWIKEGEGYPQAYPVTFVEMVNYTSIILYCDFELTLYQGDVILFDDTLIVIDKTFTFIYAPLLTDDDPLYDPDDKYHQNTLVSVLPLTNEIPIGTVGHTYALTPVYSVHTHSINQDGQTVTRNDKSLGLWTKHFVTGKGCDIPCSGHFIRDDIGFHLLYKVGQGSGFIFFELRYNPYVDTNIGTVRGIASVDISDSSNPLDFVDVNFSLKVRGTPELYTPLKLEGNPFYCPLNAVPYYKINFKVIPEEDVSNYCPQDTTGFYDFATAP